MTTKKTSTKKKTTKKKVTKKKVSKKKVVDNKNEMNKKLKELTIEERGLVLTNYANELAKKFESLIKEHSELLNLKSKVSIFLDIEGFSLKNKG